MTDSLQQSILVVCSSEIVLCGLTGLLASAGYAVTGSPNVWRACKLADSGRFALAILDLPREDESVRDLVRILHRSEARIKLLARVRANRATTPFQRQGGEIAVESFVDGDLLETVARLIGPPSAPPEGSGGRPRAA